MARSFYKMIEDNDPLRTFKGVIWKRKHSYFITLDEDVYISATKHSNLFTITKYDGKK